MQQLDKCLQNGAMLSWMAKEKTLCAKDPENGNVAFKFELMTHQLLFMWKMMPGTLAGELYRYLENSGGLLPTEQKGCRKKELGNEGVALNC